MIAKKQNNINVERYFENFDNLWAFHHQFNFENNDRAIVIVGLSYIDDLLLKCLENFFPDKSKTVKSMLGHHGILGSYSAKVDMLYSLGILDKVIKTDLDNLGEIRNEFAHKIKVSFEDNKISSICYSFKWHKIAMMMDTPKVANPIDIFKVEVNTIVSHLSGLISICINQKRVIKDEYER
jgi:DNA-binding MltR family transcriptional regulator